MFKQWEAPKLVKHITAMLEDSPNTEFTVVFKDGKRCKNLKENNEWKVWDFTTPEGDEQHLWKVIKYIENIKYAVDNNMLTLEE